MFYPESRDIYRYLWDGWLSLSGLNPYELVPLSGELIKYKESGLFGLLDYHYNSTATPYPPVAQMLFVIPAGLYQMVGLGWAKLVLGLPMFVVGGLMWRRIPNKWWVIYWLNPFIWIHLVRDSHIDGWAAMVAIVAGLLLISKKGVLSGAILALAVLIKPYTVVWLPFFVKRGGWRVLLTFGILILGVYLPYNYSLDRYVAFTYLMRRWQPGFVSPLMGGIAVGVTTLALLTRKVGWESFTIAGLVGLLAAPVIYPWYGLWLWPVALLSKKKLLVGLVGVTLVLISSRV